MFKWNYQTETPQRVPCRTEGGGDVQGKEAKERQVNCNSLRRWQWSECIPCGKWLEK